MKLAAGGGAITGPALALVAVVAPLALEAVTTARRVWPTSLAPSLYVEPVAPARFEQASPALLQRCHWRA